MTNAKTTMISAGLYLLVILVKELDQTFGKRWED